MFSFFCLLILGEHYGKANRFSGFGDGFVGCGCLQAEIPDPSDADIDKDGKVDFVDFAWLSRYWLVDTTYPGDLSRSTVLVAASDSSSQVKANADYVCDGIADDVQIQAALDSLGTPGGTVELSAGNFTISSKIVLHGGASGTANGINIVGSGLYTTKVTAVDGINDDMFYWVPAGEEYFVTIEGMMLSGNRSNQTSGHCIYTQSTDGGEANDFQMNRVFVSGAKEEECHFQSIWGYRITNCLFEHNGDCGMLIRGTENYISNNFFAYNWQNNGPETTAIGCYGNNVNWSTFIGNSFYHNNGQGLHLHDSDENTVVGNIFNNNGGGAQGRATGIQMETSVRNTITGNTFWNSSLQDYGIHFEFDSTKNIVVGNSFKSQNIGTILTDTLMNQISNNLADVYIPEQKYVIWKNTSGGQVVQGDVIVMKAAAGGNEFTTTTKAGDDMVIGMVDETIVDNAFGYVLQEGETAALKVDGTTDIVIGDLISCFTVAGVSQKALSGDMAFAVALETYTTDDSAGVISARIIRARQAK